MYTAMRDEFTGSVVTQWVQKIANNPIIITAIANQVP